MHICVHMRSLLPHVLYTISCISKLHTHKKFVYEKRKKTEVKAVAKQNVEFQMLKQVIHIVTRACSYLPNMSDVKNACSCDSVIHTSSWPDTRTTLSLPKHRGSLSVALHFVRTGVKQSSIRSIVRYK
jgi:hypothetical protein